MANANRFFFGACQYHKINRVPMPRRHTIVYNAKPVSLDIQNIAVMNAARLQEVLAYRNPEFSYPVINTGRAMPTIGTAWLCLFRNRAV
jgi:hypothetical protein